jgi:diadenylate cyclase
MLFIGVLIVSSVLKMHAIQFIFRNFYQIGLIAVVIVFQPELRAGLEKIGTTPFSGFKGLGTSDAKEMASVSEDIDVLCEAACDMARSKTGALIVIERTTKLGEYIKSGVLVNAQMSPFLLRNIFFNKAPLHDGAVIIRGHRIFAAGCFLPLSTKDDIFQSLGTRHRAAIGMSEASDAVVIVVSEETGTISIAIDGELRRNFNYNSLKQELLKLLVHTSRKSQAEDEADKK